MSLLKKTRRRPARKFASLSANEASKFRGLTPQAQVILKHLFNTGTITQREAIMDHSVQSLTRRITEIRDAGFKVNGVWKKHPLTGQRYMRYSLAAA